MKKDRTAVNPKKNRFPITTLVGDTYFNSGVNFAGIFWTRLILACCLSCSLVMFFRDNYLIPVSAFFLLAVTAGSTAVIFMLFSSLNTKYSAAVMIFAVCVFILLFREKIASQFTLMLDYMLKTLDSRLLNTSSLITTPLYRLNESYPPLCNAAELYMVMLAEIISFISVCCTRTKLRVAIVLETVAILFIPAFGAEIASYSPYMIIFTACILAMVSLRFGYDADGYFRFRTYSASSEARRREDAAYRKTTKSLLFFKKLRSDLPRYGKYTANAAVTFLLTAGLMLLATVIVPERTTVDLRDMIQSVGDFINDTITDISNSLGFTFGSLPDNGYFSGDGSVDEISTLGTDIPSTGNSPVLKVTLQDKDSPVFLRGDIGVNYSDGLWTTLTDNDMNKLPEDNSSSGNHKITAEEAREMLNGFYPEIQMEMLIHRLEFLGYNSSKFINAQCVTVDNLKTTKVVFLPVTPYQPDYKSNSALSWFGDAVLRVSGDNNYMKRFESVTLTPVLENPNLMTTLITAYHSTSEMSGSGYLMGKYTDEEYSEYSSVYNMFVNAAYTNVPESEQETIERFSELVRKSINSGKNSSAEGISVDEYCKAICTYFDNNFTYSLTTDNEKNKTNTKLGNFLFETKSGHCALFASATTLLLRYEGIPARYVTGYIVGGNDYERTDDGYVYTVREKQLHAWVEVYYEGIGWIPYDPTVAGADGGLITSPVEQSTTPAVTTTRTTESAPERTTSRTTNEKTEGSRSDSSDISETTASEPLEPVQKTDYSLLLAIIIIVFICGAVVLLTVMFITSLAKSEKKCFDAFANGNPNKQVTLMHLFILRLLKTQKLEIQRGEMPSEFAIRADSALAAQESGLTLCGIMPILEKAEFGREIISAEERTNVLEYLLSLYKNLVLRRNVFVRLFYRAIFFS